MTDWAQTTLSAVVHLQRGHDLPTPDRRAGNVPIVGSSGITGWHDKAKAKGPGVAIGRSGASIGVATFVEEDFWPLNTCLFVRDFHGNDPRWIFWLLNQIDFSGFNSGSAQPSLNRNYLASIPVRLPPLPEQRRIAGVLGALDDLIDTNEKLASELDALVNALGRQFVELTMVNSEMVPLSEAARIEKGYSYKSDELKTGGDWLVNLKNVGRSGQFRAEGLKPLSGHRAKPTHIVEHGDILVALTDLTQAREVIARPIRVRRRGAAGQLVASLDLAIVRPVEGFTKEYLQAVLSSEDFRSHALGYCNGTTVLHLGAAALPNYSIPVPDQRKLLDFSYKVGSLHAASDDAIQAVHELRRTRDELLPLLMSGKIRVREAEELVKERVG